MTQHYPASARGIRTLCHVLAWIALTSVFHGSPGHAETLYVSGYREIMLRTGPSVQHKILAVLKTGEEMTRLGVEGDYYRVSLPDGKQGYVLKTFVAVEPPPQRSLRKLEQRVKSQTEELEALRHENARLKEASARIERDASAQHVLLKQLEQERADLRRDNNLWWFLAGAGVLLAGWLMGWTRLRLKRRTRRNSFG
jgi:SH3 domain protein